MRLLLISLIFVAFVFGQSRYEFEPKAGVIEYDTLTATSSTDSDESTPVAVGNWKGAIALAVAPTLLSGTSTDVTITYAQRMLYFNFSEFQTVGTLSASEITAGTTKYYILSNLSSWGWQDEIKVKFESASGTYSVKLKYQIKGQ